MGVNLSLGDSASKQLLERSYQHHRGVGYALFELCEFMERDTQALLCIARADRQFAQSFLDISVGFFTKIALRHLALLGSLVG
jgi:hypothetical protein